MPITPLLILILLLGCSALMSGSETALFSLSNHQLYEFSRSPNRLRRSVAELMKQPRSVLLTILLGNTTINVLIFSISFVISGHLGERSSVWATLWGVVTVALVIIVGEVLAKTFAISSAVRLAPLVAPIIRTLQTFFIFRVKYWISSLSRPSIGCWVGQAEVAEEKLTVEELQSLIETSERRGVIGMTENEMLQEIVALSTVKVCMVMIPRVDMVTAPADSEPG